MNVKLNFSKTPKLPKTKVGLTQMREVKKPSLRPKRCPYCSGKVVLASASYVYPGNPNLSKNKVYVCTNFPTCSSYVGVHKGTKNALGHIADEQLRRLKMEAHNIFDIIWKHGDKTRPGAYSWLARTLKIPMELCHIGYFTAPQCELVIKVCVQYIRNNGVRNHG